MKLAQFTPVYNLKSFQFFSLFILMLFSFPALAAEGEAPSSKISARPVLAISTTSSSSLTVAATPTAGWTSVSCFGSSDGFAGVSPQGGVMPYTILWSNGFTGELQPNLVAGVYTATVTDMTGCTVVFTDTVPTPDSISSSFPLITNPSCGGCNDGSFTLSASGGTGPLSFAWSNGVNQTSSQSNLPIGNYVVTITDGNGCTNSDNITLIVSGALSVSANVVNQVSCNGFSDGSASASASGGVTPYTYIWSNGASGATASGLTAGTFTVTVTDQGGATTATSVIVTEPVATALSFTTSPESCSGNDGSIQASASGGSSPFTYNWSNGAITSSISSLTTGTYTVTVIDANGCTQTGTEVVTQSGVCTTSFLSVHCGATMSSLGDYLYYNGIAGATNYRYQIVGPGLNTVHVRGYGANNLILSHVSGVQLASTYTISIAAFVAGQWLGYGPTCSISTPANVPTTQLLTSSCNVTVTSLSQWLFCTGVPGADNYRYEVTGSGGFSQVYTRGYGSTSFRIGFVSGISYNTTYNVRVAASINGSFGAYGPTCTVTTPGSTPTTQLNTAFCNATLSSWQTYLSYPTIPGATNYRYEVTGTGFNTVRVRNAPSPVFRFDWIAGVQPNTTYNLRIAAYIGGAWGNYGTSCTVTTPNIPLRIGFFDQVEAVELEEPAESTNSFDLKVFPNPNTGSFVVGGQANDLVQLQVLDATGRMVMKSENLPVGGIFRWAVELPGHLGAGLYFIQGQSGDQTVVAKVLVQ